MAYRLTKDDLISTLSAWNRFLKRPIHLVACGGTALTLIGVKASTKDVDFMVPVKTEYDYLISVIKNLGYSSKTGWGWQREGEAYIFDLFPGSSIHTTDLLESPLDEGNNVLLFELKNLYVGVLNYYDLLISKLFRGDSVDVEDCLMLFRQKHREIDLAKFSARFIETAKFDTSEEKHRKMLKYFLNIVGKETFNEG